MVPYHYAKANNPLIADQYDASNPTSFILYTDCNNLYGVAMSQLLPYGDFYSLSRNEIDSLDVRTLSAVSYTHLDVYKRQTLYC